LTTAATAQVKITVPVRQYKVGEEIPAKVENGGKYAITFCVEFGQTSMKGGEVESTPSPFWVQQNDDGKWGTLIIGPDVGSFRGAIVLEVGRVKRFSVPPERSGKDATPTQLLARFFSRLGLPCKAKGQKAVDVGDFHNRIACATCSSGLAQRLLSFSTSLYSLSIFFWILSLSSAFGYRSR
jgi:hypothetical protein